MEGRYSFGLTNGVCEEKLSDYCLMNSDEERKCTVNSYQQEGLGWRWDLLSHKLPASMLLKHADVTIQLDARPVDRPRWMTVNNMAFSVRTAYQVLQRETTVEEWTGWKRIWRFEVQERVKVFLQLLAHDKVLSNWSRWRRMLSPSPGCQRCLADKEDAIHEVCDCPDQKEVWLKLIPPDLHQSFFSMGLREWLTMNLMYKGRSILEAKWPACMALTSWKLWKWRCLELFEQRHLSVEQKVEEVRMSICEMERAFKICLGDRAREWHCNILRNNQCLGLGPVYQSKKRNECNLSIRATLKFSDV